MRIGVNAFGCNHGRSGAGSYLLSLVNNLPQSEFKFSLFGHELDRYTYTSSLDGVNFNGIDIKDTDFSERFWHKTSLNPFIKKQKYDAVLYVSGLRLLPMTFNVPSILVIQEAPENLQGLAKIRMRSVFNQVSGTIVPSKYVRKALLNLGVPPDKICVIHNGINDELFKPCGLKNGETVLVQPFSIRRPYIIYASRLANSSKCHVQLIKAFAVFKKKSGAPHRLVIAGAEGESSSAVHAEVLNSPYSSDILLTGYFPHENLPKLYSAADLSIFPSRNEGSGLPVIEAMACGVPTACSNEGALPEIAGEASLYFNSENPEEIAETILRLIDTPENAECRNKLITAGSEWIKKYSWKKTAEETIGYITSCLKRSSKLDNKKAGGIPYYFKTVYL